MRHPIFILIIASLLVAGCSLNPPKPVVMDAPSHPALTTAYDYQLLDAAFKAVSFTQLAEKLKHSNAIFIGEYHGNQASHLLQTQLLVALHQQNQIDKRSMILALEMFSRDQQGILNDYLNGAIGERYLVDNAPTWTGYTGSHRPLVEYAKQHAIPVIAANAPNAMVRCIGRQGAAYTKKLSDLEKANIARQPFAEVPGYADKFFGVMQASKHSPSTRMRQSYLAQLSRDNTMAESIMQALAQEPDGQLININGSFHSAGHLGAAGALRRLQPDLKITVITPVHSDKLAAFKQAQTSDSRDEFYYLLNPQPPAFVNAANRKKAHQAMFAKADQKAKDC